MLTDRVQVEQRLGWVLVHAVAGVDDRCGHPARQAVRCAGRAVPDHDRIDAHRLDRLRGVLQALALLNRRPGYAEVHDVGGEALRGKLERRPRARRRFVEEVHDGLASQRRVLAHDPRPVRLEGRRGCQHAFDPFGVEIPDRQQVTDHRAASSAVSPTAPSSTPSSPSSSAIFTRTSSLRPVGTFLPT